MNFEEAEKTPPRMLSFANHMDDPELGHRHRHSEGFGSSTLHSAFPPSSFVSPDGNAPVETIAHQMSEVLRAVEMKVKCIQVRAKMTLIRIACV